MKKDISLIIPTYNSSKYIEMCLESIFSSMIIPKQILLVDGGSTDKTTNIALKYDVEVINSKKGLAKQRNKGIRHAKFAFLLFLDSDVIINKDYITKMYNLIKKNENVYAVGGKLIEKNKKSIADRWRAFHMNQNWGDKDIKNPRFLFGSNFIIKKEVFQKVGHFDEKYDTNYEDVDFFDRLNKKRLNIKYISNAVCYHLKKDTVISVMKSSYRWQYYSYLLPLNLINLLIKIIIINPYKSIRFILNSIFELKFDLFLLDILMFFIHSYYDILKFAKK